jgi:hypothetical protein
MRSGCASSPLWWQRAGGRPRGLVPRAFALWPVDEDPRRANALNLTIGVVLTSGEAHDATAYTALMEERDSDPGVLLGDRAYDSNEIRRDARDRGSTPQIPPRRSRKVQHSVDRILYALRSRVECFINRRSRR